MSHPAQLAIEPARRRPVALAVEDDGFERMRLAAILDRLGFDVLSAADGAEALATLSSRKADVVVTDWQLPALSGLDLCRALRGTDPAQRPFTMLVTARDQVEDLVEGLEAGADDFIAKPYRAEELAARLRSGQRLLAMRRELGERTRMLETALSHQGRMREGFTADLTAAAQLQHQLLEQATAGIPGLALAHMFRPARHLGGDVFGVAPLAPGRAAFFHIDATGHGIAAALHAFAIATSVLGLGGHEAALDDPAAWVGALNERALRLGADIGCSLVVGWLDLATRQGRLCQAGLPHPLALSRAGLVRRLGNGGLPVGGLDGARYVTTEFTLEQGERLVLHSDGVTDCVNPAGAPFGSERLARVLAAAASRPIGELVRLVGRELDDWRGTAVHDDDLSLMVLETGGER